MRNEELGAEPDVRPKTVSTQEASGFSGSHFASTASIFSRRWVYRLSIECQLSHIQVVLGSSILNIDKFHINSLINEILNRKEYFN